MGGLAPLVRAAVYGTAVVVERGFDAAETPDSMAAHGATGVSVVPTMVRRLLDRHWSPHDALRVVLCGGAPTPPSIVREAAEAGVPLFPTYGTTETASQVATATPSQAAETPRTVGSPLLTAGVTLVDTDDGSPVDAGTVGELVVDGPVVTPGYLDAETPVGEFGLHTGDLASRDRAGRLEIHGRLDDAIQTGGEVVHPARVVAALRSQPEVADAAVVGVEDAEWGERVCALIVPVGDRRPALDDLRRSLEADLAPYERPREVATTESLPRTASGTVDRDAVRARFGDRRHDA
jgi:O-succinylbenzoic acid--CoA ligase